jgi:hypothetical protein
MNYRPVTACKQYCLAEGATQGKIACTQNVGFNARRKNNLKKQK